MLLSAVVFLNQAITYGLDVPYKIERKRYPEGIKVAQPKQTPSNCSLRHIFFHSLPCLPLYAVRTSRRCCSNNGC